eukprot:4163596-Amphidinium_carterae.1
MVSQSSHAISYQHHRYKTADRASEEIVLRVIETEAWETRPNRLLNKAALYLVGTKVSGKDAFCKCCATTQARALRKKLREIEKLKETTLREMIITSFAQSPLNLHDRHRSMWKQHPPQVVACVEVSVCV